jgi:hypothetical protein
MGSGRWDPSDWKGYTSSRSYDTKSTAGIYASSGMDPLLDPKGVKIRESRDSADNPRSTPIIVGLDVTGSMGMVADVMARKGLNTLITSVYDRKPVTDPHVMIMGIGDVNYGHAGSSGDSAPLQVTQFEADVRLAEQLEKLYLEHGGGGNLSESYALAWYFAAHHTAIDSFEKRGIKGYLFTIGDEHPTELLTASDIERVLGYKPQADVDLEALLTLVSRQWEIFHVIAAEGDCASRYAKSVRDKWSAMIGQRALWLSDHTKLAELITSVIQIHEGTDARRVVDSWDGSTALVIRDAVAGLTKKDTTAGDVVRL